MIPKKHWTAWLSEDPIKPELIQKCFKTHTMEGYEYQIIDLPEAYRIALGLFDETVDKDYLYDCLETKQWAKACDYLRIYLLYHYGGVWTDADTSILPYKNFDAFLNHQIFCGREKNNFVSNAIIGAEKGQSLLKEYLDTVDENFRGTGKLVMATGLYLWNEMIWAAPKDTVAIYPDDYFLPYCHQENTWNQTENTVCVHHFNKSWVK